MSVSESLLANAAIIDETVGSHRVEKDSLTVVVFASGTRGDVQPYIALGLHLKSFGNNVCIATELRMKGLVEDFGLTHRCLGGDPSGFIFEPGAQEVLAGASMFGLIKITEEWDKKYPKADILSTYESCAEGADVIIAAALTLTGAYCISEKLNIPFIPVILGATMPTSEFPLWALESIAVCSCLNKWTYNAAFKALWSSESKYINPWRVEKLGLPPITFTKGISDILDIVSPPIIIACAKKVIGRTGEIPADYPSHVHFPGFFFVPSAVESDIDPVLVQFLGNNSEQRKTVYLGFGSMPAVNPKALMKLAIDTCLAVGCRAVVVAGWSSLDDADCQAIITPAINNGTILLIKGAPHDWLFPRCDCIVHHSGVGTMAAALRSGRPQVPCPVMLDQPYNSRTVLRLGCALDIIPFAKLTSLALSKALRRVFANEHNVIEAAQAIQADIEEESKLALDVATEIILDYSRNFRSKQLVAK